MIDIVVNGKEKQVDGAISLQDLLETLGLSNERIAIEINKHVVRKKDWANTTVQNEDKLEIIHFVGGG